MPLKFAANISMMFTEISSFAGRYAAAKKAGFRAVECVFPYNFPREEIAAAKKESDWSMFSWTATPVRTAETQLGHRIIHAALSLLHHN